MIFHQQLLTLQLKIIHHFHLTLFFSHLAILHIQEACNLFLFLNSLIHFFLDSYLELLNFFSLIKVLHYFFTFYHKFLKKFQDIIFLILIKHSL